MFQCVWFVMYLFTTVVIGILLILSVPIIIIFLYFVVFVIVKAVPMKITINQSFCLQLSRN